MAVSCSIGHRHGLDPVLLWLWYRPVAAALIQLLAWELPYAPGAALKTENKQTKCVQDTNAKPVNTNFEVCCS